MFANELEAWKYSLMFCKRIRVNVTGDLIRKCELNYLSYVGGEYSYKAPKLDISFSEACGVS